MRTFYAMQHAVRTLGLVGVLALLMAISPLVLADSDALRPLTLAYTTSGGEVQHEAEAVRERLEQADFQVLGEYPVDAERHVVVVTHPDLLAVAGADPRSAYIAPIRVAITAVNGEIQVSYNHLEYFRHAYRLEAEVNPVTRRLAEVLGAERYFGSEDGLSARALNRYRYTFGMERFDMPYELGAFGSRAEALASIEAQLAAGDLGVSEVYRIEFPEQDVTLLGIAIRATEGAPEVASDLHTLQTIDVGELRHTAYVPYEILVHGGRVEALHMRFRAALHWPDLRMLGDHSFMRLRAVPGELEELFQTVVDAAEEDAGFQW